MSRLLPARRTRLVATIGPASVERVDRLVTAGLDVARVRGGPNALELLRL